MKTPNELIVDYLQDALPDEEIKRLFEWIRESPVNAQQFARESLLHGHLRAQLSGEHITKSVLPRPAVLHLSNQQALPLQVAPHTPADSVNERIQLRRSASPVSCPARMRLQQTRSRRPWLRLPFQPCRPEAVAHRC